MVRPVNHCLIQRQDMLELRYKFKNENDQLSNPWSMHSYKNKDRANAN